jgi:hypothetical protein
MKNESFKEKSIINNSERSFTCSIDEKKNENKSNEVIKLIKINKY